MSTEKKTTAAQETQTPAEAVGTVAYCRPDCQGHRSAVHRIRGWPARKAERESGAGAASERTDRSAG